MKKLRKIVINFKTSQLFGVIRKNKDNKILFKLYLGYIEELNNIYIANKICTFF